MTKRVRTSRDIWLTLLWDAAYNSLNPVKPELTIEAVGHVGELG